jgi:hypothetical protein
MPNEEMMRLCIIKDISESPFDACIAEVFKDSEDLEAYILVREEKNRMCLFKHYVKCNSIEELDSMYNSWVCSLADALNAPVLATKKVLDAMEKAGGAYSAKSILVNAPDYSYNLHFDEEKKAFTFRGGMTFDVNEQDVPIYTVQADCPLALQVLLGFTTEGVPVNE